MESVRESFMKRMGRTSINRQRWRRTTNFMNARKTSRKRTYSRNAIVDILDKREEILSSAYVQLINLYSIGIGVKNDADGGRSPRCEYDL